MNKKAIIIPIVVLAAGAAAYVLHRNATAGAREATLYGNVDIREATLAFRVAGRVETLETDYSAFRGSRNLRGRSLKVKEYLFLVEKF